jgi:murein DD-endopeptidase MepM/ murein hydrolase activator NlpD
MPKRIGRVLISLMVIILLVTSYELWINPAFRSSRSRNLLSFLRQPETHTEWVTPALQRCSDAPFQMPTSGYIGYIWEDSFRIGHHHQGIDIFGGAEAGLVPVYAAYDGYLTRLADWKSSLIMRVPADPFNAGRQIWLYYTHMAYENGESLISSDFPAGTSEVFVKAGTLLGHQGNYSGSPDNPTGVHLHFSIVKDDGQGKFLNELEIENTLDPSPYFGMNLNNKAGGMTPVSCNP